MNPSIFRICVGVIGSAADLLFNDISIKMQNKRQLQMYDSAIEHADKIKEHVKNGELDEGLGVRILKGEAPKEALVEAAQEKADGQYSGTSQMSAAGRACIPCVPPYSIVISNKGVTQINQISSGDEVLDARGKYSTVLDVMVREYHGDLVSIKIPYQTESIILTPEHPILAVKAKGCRKSVARGNICLPGKDNWHCENCKEQRIYDHDWIPAKDLVKQQGKKQFTKYVLLMPRITETTDVDTITMPNLAHKVPVKEVVKVDSDFMKIAGLYLAEGSTHFGMRGALVRIDLGGSEMDIAKEATRLIYKVFGVRAKISKPTPSTVRVELSSIVLGRFLTELFGVGALNKRIPYWMQTLPAEKQISLIKGYWIGDGSRRRERRKGRELNAICLSATTVSPDLAYGIRTLLFRIGIIHSLDKRLHKDSKINGRTIVSNGVRYTIRVSGPSAIKLAKLIDQPGCDKWRFLQSHVAGIDALWLYLPVKEVSVIPYNGQVINLKTFPSNSYTVYGVAVHNCGNDHFSTVSGLLAEAMRFARDKGVSDPEVVLRIAQAEDELNAFERVDAAPDKITALPPEERVMMDEMLRASRGFRHSLSDVHNTDDLVRLATEVKNKRDEFRLKVFGMQVAQS